MNFRIIWFCHTFRDAGRGCPEVRAAAADSSPGVLTRFPVGRRHSACHVQVAESCCQVACFTGAVVLSRNQVRCSGQEYPLAQQVGFPTSVHRRLELLDAVDGALDGTGVVVQGEPGDDGVQVAAQPGCERPQLR